MIFSVVILLGLLTCSNGSFLDVSQVRVIGADHDGFPNSKEVPVNSATVSVLAAGSVIVSGTMDFSASNGSFMRSYDATGAVLWTNQLDMHLVDSCTDSKDNIFAVGACRVSNNYDICVVKFDTFGHTLNKFRSGSAAFDSPRAVAVSPRDGTVYTVGATSSASWDNTTQSGPYDGFLLAHSSVGVQLGLYRYGVTERETEWETHFTDVAVDSTGDVWLAGYTTDEKMDSDFIGSTEVVVQKLSTAGELLFAAVVDETRDEVSNSQGPCIAIDASDYVYVAGSVVSAKDGIGSVRQTDIFVAKLNASGANMWYFVYNSKLQNSATAVTVDAVSGLVYVTGYTTSPMFFGSANPITTGTGSAFLLVLSPLNGAVVSARVYAGTDASVANDIAVRGGSVYLAGAASGTFQEHIIGDKQGALLLQVEGYSKTEILSSKEELRS